MYNNRETTNSEPIARHSLASKAFYAGLFDPLTLVKADTTSMA